MFLKFKINKKKNIDLIIDRETHIVQWTVNNIELCNVKSLQCVCVCVCVCVYTYIKWY